jgi:GNAT superfamily N-acetyltransferase
MARFYFVNPYGDAIVALGWSGDLLVGHQALVPHALTDGYGGEYRYYLAMSLMLHPDHRGFPAFHRLVATTTAVARQEGAPFILGFPNGNSYALFQRAFGWKTLLETELYNWHPATPAAPPRSITPLPHLRLTDEAGPPCDETYRQWRSLELPYYAERVNGQLAVIYKIDRNGTLTLLDASTDAPQRHGGRSCRVADIRWRTPGAHDRCACPDDRSRSIAHGATHRLPVAHVLCSDHGGSAAVAFQFAVERCVLTNEGVDA